MSVDINVRAGKLNRRIVIKSPPSTPDATGFISDAPDLNSFATWPVIIATCAAQIEPGTGNEKRQSDREINESPVMIYVRFGVGKHLTSSMWAQNLVSGEIYDIRDVSQVEDGRRLTQLTCRVVT